MGRGAGAHHHGARHQPREPLRAAPPDRACGPVVIARVLFVCLHNAGRSQMSQAWFEQIADGRHEARSAGTEPAEHVHANVVAAMREEGIDLDRRKPQLLTNELARWADVVVTMGCGDACPVIPGKRYVDWELPDPSGLPIEDVRAIREDIRSRVDVLVKDLDRETVRG